MKRATKDPELRIEAEHELGRRLRPGSLAHIGLMLVVVAFTPFRNDHPSEVLAFTASLTVVSLLRFCLSRCQHRFYPAHRRGWLALFDVSFVLSALIWGLLCVVSIRYYGLESLPSLVVFLMVSGICGGAATSLNPSRRRALLFLALILGIPVVEILRLRSDPEHLGFAFIFVIYFLFLFFQVRGQSEIYWDRLWAKKKVTDQKREIEASLEKAELAARTKSIFLANMSHEIRTPMNGMIGMCELLLTEIKNPAQEEKLKIIRNCGHTLSELVNDILDFSKLEAGKIDLEKEPFPVHDTVQELVDLFRGRAQEKGLTLLYVPSPAVPPWISGDVTRFRQVLTNLLGNALKFTQKGGVRVSTESEERNGQMFLSVSVSDTGAGIKPELLDRLFTPFSQADASTTRKYGGTGLGLSISKGLCERMGGSISLKTKDGRGSTFTFLLPLEPAEAQRLPQAEPGVDRRPLRILVVEDNRVNQLVALGFLNKLGYQAEVASNGVEAVEKCTAADFDLVLMDCQMPEMDGIEATRRIRALPARRQPRIVALSASVMQEDVKRYQEAGMDDFLGKPLVLADLVAALKDAA